jgi:hypothetical protein
MGLLVINNSQRVLVYYILLICLMAAFGIAHIHYISLLESLSTFKAI